MLLGRSVVYWSMGQRVEVQLQGPSNQSHSSYEYNDRLQGWGLWLDIHALQRSRQALFSNKQGGVVPESSKMLNPTNRISQPNFASRFISLSLATATNLDIFPRPQRLKTIECSGLKLILKFTVSKEKVNM